MSYKDIMTKKWSGLFDPPGAAVLEAAETPCHSCDWCGIKAIANGCEVTNCIVCGHEINRGDLRGMHSRAWYTCAGCGATLLICSSIGQVGRIITGYYVHGTHYPR